ncbi:tetratricopeptide repeat protein [Aureivirga sp. CE67]|uniref:tetratricopeptide repeat protein n=1 Tax=Aureivirga sp. CE67 TaxID=1788983 RepID=UPI0018C9E8E5|nr:tetratricopeptide repeat protein [Aureivirga sp. CE67]
MNKIDYWLEKGIHFFNIGSYYQSRVYFDKILEIDATNYEALNHKALSYLHENLDEMAKQCFFQILKNKPESVLTYLYLGNIEKKNNDFEKAIFFYEKAIEYITDENYQHILYYNLGKVLLDRVDEIEFSDDNSEVEKMRERAEKCFQKSRELNK